MPRSAHLRGSARLRVWNGPSASTTTPGFCAMIWGIASGRDMSTIRNRARSPPNTRTVLPAETALRPATTTSMFPYRARLAAIRLPNTPYPPRTSTTGRATLSVYAIGLPMRSYGGPVSVRLTSGALRYLLVFPATDRPASGQNRHRESLNAGADHVTFFDIPGVNPLRLDPEDLPLPGQGHLPLARLERAAQRHEERRARRRGSRRAGPGRAEAHLGALGRLQHPAGNVGAQGGRRRAEAPGRHARGQERLGPHRL